MKKFHPVYLFLLIPYAAWVLGAVLQPHRAHLLGIPFFYWWQIAGIFLTALCIVPVYLYQEGRRK